MPAIPIIILKRSTQILSRVCVYRDKSQNIWMRFRFLLFFSGQHIFKSTLKIASVEGEACLLHEQTGVSFHFPDCGG